MQSSLWKPMYWAGIVGVVLGASGCAWLPSGEPAQPRLEVLQAHVQPDAPAYRFRFVENDGLRQRPGVFGGGLIVVSQGDEELQAIEHDFGLLFDEVPTQQWLSFLDANGDGLDDFVVQYRVGEDDGPVVGRLYTFEEETGRFVLSEAMSGVGRIDPIHPGCLQITQSTADGRSGRQEHCYSPQAKRWFRQLALPGAGVVDENDVQAINAASDRPGCTGPTPALAECRQLRMQVDRALNKVLNEHKQDQRPALQRERGRAYAQRFAVNLDASHRSWLQYRDNRCLAYVREQGFQAPLFQSANEACRYRLGQWQLQHYRAQ
jgi:uncharacterized protein YecT (DUF1311 family)